MNLRRFGLGMFAAAFLMLAAVLSFAADDPPSRVARLKYLDGQVSVQPGGVDEWVAANINRPLTTADNVWTDRDSRAELHLGTAALRMNSQTSVTLTNLTDSTVQVQLHQGTLNLHIADLFRGEIYEVDTPNTAFTVEKSGSYRFDVDANGDTTLVTVWSGKGIATGDGPAVEVRGHEQARFGSGKSLAHQIYKAPPFDGFDDWARVRDSREDHLYSVRYVPRSVIGYEDLDEYGYWRLVPSYGWVWAPRVVSVGWAPYRFGHWIWVSPWGWTWVDDAPWGFAPFHYGRWIYWDGGWVWVPGRRVARPVYAPALVVFVGGGGRNFGVAWFPLGPEEPYVPAYHVSNTYFRNVNVTNVNVTNINVTNVNVTTINYRNRRAPDAFTVVSQETFARSRAVDKSVIVVPRERLDQARVVGSTARVVPDRHSVLGRPDIMTVRRPPSAVTTREVVVRREPPPPPVPFMARQRALRTHPGRPLDETTLGTLRRQSPPDRTKPLVRPAVPVATQDRPTPVLRPTREGLPPPRALPPPAPAERAAPVERPDRPGRPDRAGEPERSESPRPARQPAERPAPEERPARKARPEPQASPVEKPAPPERARAPERRAPKGHAAERDTTKEKKP